MGILVTSSDPIPADKVVELCRGKVIAAKNLWNGRGYMEWEIVVWDQNAEVTRRLSMKNYPVSYVPVVKDAPLSCLAAASAYSSWESMWINQLATAATVIQRSAEICRGSLVNVPGIGLAKVEGYMPAKFGREMVSVSTSEGAKQGYIVPMNKLTLVPNYDLSKHGDMVGTGPFLEAISIPTLLAALTEPELVPVGTQQFVEPCHILAAKAAPLLNPLIDELESRGDSKVDRLKAFVKKLTYRYCQESDQFLPIEE